MFSMSLSVQQKHSHPQRGEIHSDASGLNSATSMCILNVLILKTAVDVAYCLWLVCGDGDPSIHV